MDDQGVGLEELQVWQRSMALAVHICRTIVPRLPGEEKWALASQMRRSSQSVPANIAEGYGRYYYQDTIHFCYIARGSLEELFTQLSLAHQFGYLSDPDFVKTISDVREIRKMLNGYIQYLKKSKRGEKEPGNTSIIRDAFIVYDADIDPLSSDS